MTRTFDTTATVEINVFTDKVTVYRNTEDRYVETVKPIVNTYEQKTQAMKDRIEELRRQREYRELGIIF